MREIMISINQEYIVDIFNGKKIVEVRKTIPKCKFPVTVYIYCTKSKNGEVLDDNYNHFINQRYWFLTKSWTPNENNGKVLAKFTFKDYANIKNVPEQFHIFTEIAEKACLSPKELSDYLKGKNGYGWFIEDLVIFDKPKDLSDFLVYSHTVDGVNEKNQPQKYKVLKHLTEAPQSWVYIECLDERGVK